MKLTTKGRFAVTAMIDVAMHNAQEPVTLAEVSERQKISLSYLEQLFGKLRRAGLVASVRGPGGGYNLARPSAMVSVADIIVAVDEPNHATRCGGAQNCHEGEVCLTHDLWAGLNAHIFAYLRGVSLQSLVDAAHSRDALRKSAPTKPATVVLQERRPSLLAPLLGV